MENHCVCPHARTIFVPGSGLGATMLLVGTQATILHHTILGPQKASHYAQIYGWIDQVGVASLDFSFFQIKISHSRICSRILDCYVVIEEIPLGWKKFRIFLFINDMSWRGSVDSRYSNRAIPVLVGCAYSCSCFCIS